MKHRTGCRGALELCSELATVAFVGVTLVACDPTPPGGGGGGAAGVGGVSGTGGASGAAGSSGASGSGGTGGLYTFAPFRTNLIRVTPASGGAAGAGGSGTAGVGGVGGAGASGSAGTGGALAQCVPSAPPGSPPMSAVCGDGFRAATEDCDDGNMSNADSCSASCKVTPELVDPRAATLAALPLPSRSLGSSGHPMAAGCNAVGVSFVDRTSTPPALELSTYSSSGVPAATIRYGTGTVDFPDPAVAALPGDAFALAWTDLGADGDELGVQLRRIDPNATQQQPSIVANEASAFSQSAPDIVFDGKELVVAWMDNTDPATAPDLVYRLFAPDLTPLTGDVSLAKTNAVEGDVALAALNGSWAAAWRSGAAGLEKIEVQSGALHWTVGPFLPGLAGDRPDLTFLDATHLALAFTMGTDPNSTGVANVSRLHGAILDAAAPGSVGSFPIPPAQDAYAFSPTVDQSQPALALFPDHLLVSWRSGAIPGDAKDSELWSRRMPFTVASDHSVTVDPSHVEQPTVRADAQRVGDQSAFRLLSTNLWPGGGLVAAWDDHGRSFGKISGVPDVAVQFLPDILEPPPAVTPYPVSADGKYYLVNVLKRNYAPPTVTATYANGAAPGSNPPSAIFDGSSNPYGWTTPTASDPDATVVITVDMGRYFSVGAILPWDYAPAYVNWPTTTKIRLASDLSHWTTVVPAGTPGAAFTTYEVDPPVTARFLELTQMGTPSAARVNLTELFVYPSSQSSPPPTSADGYDLGYFAKTTVSSNMYPPGAKLPLIWPAGSSFTYPPGATSNGYINVDYGAQYPIARVGACLYGQWANGGRLEVAALPDSFQSVADSGVGQPFGQPTVTQLPPCTEYPLAAQPVRYLRATDYFVPNVGLAQNGSWALTAYTTPPPIPAYYPLSADGKYFNVNLLRRPLSVAQPTASVVYANGAVQNPPSPSVQDMTTAFDGDDTSFGWGTPAGANPNATATLTIDLGHVESIGGIGGVASGFVSYGLRVAQTPGAWTQVVSNTPLTANAIASSFDAAPARYLELTMTGTTPSRFAGVNELLVYPSSANSPAPDSTSQHDLGYLPGLTITCNANMAMGTNTTARSQQLYCVGKSFPAATGDGTITYDLAQQYQISQISLPFFLNKNWPGGGKIEVDDGSGTWVTVFDSGRGTPLGLVAGTQNIAFPTRTARFIRFTDYFIPGVGCSYGWFYNFEVF